MKNSLKLSVKTKTQKRQEKKWIQRIKKSEKCDDKKKQMIFGCVSYKRENTEKQYFVFVLILQRIYEFDGINKSR